MTLAGKVKAAKGATSPTAELCAVVRAAETLRPRRARLFTDPFARYFLQNWRFRSTHPIPPVFKLCIQLADKRYTGLIAETALRHRHCEEIIAAEVADGCRQVVVLGAGYDTTALRGGLGPDTVVYEVDKPDTQAEKIAIMQRHGLRPTQPVKYVSCDFDRDDDLVERMLEHGFDRDERSVVIWMGVTYYLSPASVRATMDKLSRITSADSKVIFDYIDASALDGSSGHEGAERGTQLVSSGGEPFVFGLDRDDIADFYATGGFTISAHHRVPELLHRYGDPATFWLTAVDFMGVVTLRRESD